MSYLANHWCSFQTNAMPPETDAHTAFALKGAFYSGISVALMALGNDGVSFDALLAECKGYANELEDSPSKQH